MITGLGTDLVELERIRRIYNKWGIRFAIRFLNEEELASMPLEPIAWLAGRFAAKEACAKALGTGFQNGIVWHDMVIMPDSLGKPKMRLYGKAKTLADAMGAKFVHLSISHERTMACAVLILES